MGGNKSKPFKDSAKEVLARRAAAAKETAAQTAEKRAVSAGYPGKAPTAQGNVPPAGTPPVPLQDMPGLQSTMPPAHLMPEQSYNPEVLKEMAKWKHIEKVEKHSLDYLDEEAAEQSANVIRHKDELKYRHLRRSDGSIQVAGRLSEIAMIDMFIKFRDRENYSVAMAAKDYNLPEDVVEKAIKAARMPVFSEYDKEDEREAT
jgi:hypothetical protein